MNNLESEEALSRDWLNFREPYDSKARDPEILQRVVSLARALTTSGLPNPILADLGSGTGNNVLFLQQYLASSTHYQLVEQHEFLLEESRRRLTKLAPAEHLEFHHSSINEWLEANDPDMLTNSALLDLFTEDELRSLCQYLEFRKIPMYASLNYSGVTFSPIDPADQEFIALFEQHMSRNLNRGKPLGAATCKTLETIVNACQGLQFANADSDWSVPANDTDFIKMNLEFYEKGIREVITHDSQHGNLDRWISSKRQLLAERKLSLIVHHQDFLITPN